MDSLRNKHLVARHIDVALVYKDLLGVDEAMAYLARAGVSRGVAELVLSAGGAREASEPGPRPSLRCRRKNLVHDAVVEAALKIERRFGTDYALALLQQQGVPEAVATRVTEPRPRRIRSRKIVESAVLGAIAP